jgi:hypothetical protein
MIKLSFAIPRDHARLFADYVHLNGYKFEMVNKVDGPTIIIVELNAATVGAAFNPHESIAPVASA